MKLHHTNTFYFFFNFFHLLSFIHSFFYLGFVKVFLHFIPFFLLLNDLHRDMEVWEKQQKNLSILFIADFNNTHNVSLTACACVFNVI
jgi:hypothetical protein